MFADVVLPNLGFGMEEGQLIAWLKQPGDTVKRGEPIAEIESDKATVELEAVVDGILEERLYSANTMVPVGAVLARIRTDSSTTPVAETSQVVVATSPASESDRRVTPLARRVADEHGLDLSSVQGTGPGGRITRNDVQGMMQSNGSANGNSTHILAAPAIRKLARDNQIDLYLVPATGSVGQITRADLERYMLAKVTIAPQAETLPQPVPTVRTSAAPITASADEDRVEIPLTPMRQTIAKRLTQSMQEAPHYYVTAEFDLTNALRSLSREVGINNLLLYLTVQALRDMPQLNATYENGHLYQYKHVNLAIAVALDTGLITPVLAHADDYSLTGLASRSRDLIARARVGKLRQDELGGGTFTISNLGVVKQIDRFTAIINPPQIGILAIGAAKDRPIVIDGGLHIRKTIHVTLSADHRIIDGLLAARFIEAFDNHLQAFVG
jgi:pyruvate dehydrogenase E2 component (dihydrolipoamide acetyltransferase)